MQEFCYCKTISVCARGGWVGGGEVGRGRSGYGEGRWVEGEVGREGEEVGKGGGHFIRIFGNSCWLSWYFYSTSSCRGFQSDVKSQTTCRCVHFLCLVNFLS